MIKRLAFFLLLALSLTVGLAAGTNAANSCPSFHVLHNDSIGQVKIPAGMYSVAPVGVTCKNSSTLIARFLNDYDGVLPGGWAVAASGKTITFKKGATTESIVMKRGYSPASGGSSNRQNGACPGTFTVLHNDRVGTMALKAGQYKITTKGLYCWFDASKLAYLLDYTEGTKLPSPWTVDAAMMKIQRSPNHYLTLKYLGNSGGGGHSTAGKTRCNSKLKVTTAGVLAGMSFPVGSYYVNVAPGTTCAGAGSLFQKWLTAGAVNNSWKVNSQTATFTLNSKSFQLEPAS
ncbi:MAG: hypothetical protein QM648_00150 [Solirubrobacterales bacterium]